MTKEQEEKGVEKKPRKRATKPSSAVADESNITKPKTSRAKKDTTKSSAKTVKKSTRKPAPKKAPQIVYQEDNYEPSFVF